MEVRAFAVYDSSGFRVIIEEELVKCADCLPSRVDLGGACGEIEPLCKKRKISRGLRSDGGGPSVVACFFDKATNRQVSASLRLMKSAALSASAVIDSAATQNRVESEVLLHNARSLNAQSALSLARAFGENLDDERNEIREAFSSKPDVASNAILVAMKCSKLLSSELDIFEFLTSDYHLSKIDLERHNIHKIIVLALNLTHADLAERNIFISLGDCDLQVLIHFDTVKTAILQTFNNLAKYTRPSSTVVIDFQENQETVKLKIRMQSALLHPGEVDRLFEFGFRGKEAISVAASGQGVGMMVARRMITLNGGEIEFNAGEDEIRVDDRSYAWNEVVISLPRPLT